MKPDEAAQLMLGLLTSRGYLDQEVAAFELVKRDKSLVYYNDAGNLALSRAVLNAFRKLLPDNVVWSRGERHWRFRQPYDRAGRLQD